MPQDQMEQIKHHSDHPTLIDKLKRTEMVKNKANQVVNCTPPQVFGVHGDWGSGKTSYLQQLRFHLDGQSPKNSQEIGGNLLPKGKYKDSVNTIWFDAWRYQHEKAPIIALLHEIRSQFSTFDKIKKSTGKIGHVTINALLNGFSDVAKLLSFETIPVDVKGIQKIGEKWEKEHLENKLGTNNLHDFLEQAISTLLNAAIFGTESNRKEKNAKLVIIIDDLDRCDPISAYRLLEGLKVYFSLKNCVFVIGMNQKIIIDAIAQQISIGGSFGDCPKIRGEAYLEKMCNSIERLNPVSNSIDLMKMWINNSNFNQELTLALTKEDGESVNCLPPNPRRIKALSNILNQWAPLVGLCTKQKSTPEIMRKAQAVLIIAYIYQFHGEIFQRWQYTNSFYSLLKKWVKDYQYNNSEKYPPYLTNLELPEKANETDPFLDVPVENIISNYPDPYASNVFWIAPLITSADLNEIDINPILEIISKGQIQ
jgi:hypothetical protein